MPNAPLGPAPATVQSPVAGPPPGRVLAALSAPSQARLPRLGIPGALQAAAGRNDGAPGYTCQAATHARPENAEIR